jgi:flagellar biosynthesis protein FlhG
MLDQAQKLRQMVQNNIAQTYAPRIITVTSGKGGVGKSNIVVNLSIALQKMGKRVLIFDADIGMGNDDVLMGVLPKYNVFDIIFNNKEIHEVVMTGPYGVKLLPGGTGMNRIEELTNKQRENFLSKLSNIKDLDYIIMDTGAGINRSVLGFVACCEDLIVITTPEPTSLTDAYSLLKAVNHFKIKTKAKVIVNKVMDKKEGEIAFKKFSNAVLTFLKMDLEYLGYVYEDKKLVQAVRMQQPFLITFPTCEASQNIEKIAENIAGNIDQSTGMGIQGLFKKIFSIFS